METDSGVLLAGELTIFSEELYHSDGCNRREIVRNRNMHGQANNLQRQRLNITVFTKMGIIHTNY
jgi:hypothetical protein